MNGQVMIYDHLETLHCFLYSLFIWVFAVVIFCDWCSLVEMIFGWYKDWSPTWVTWHTGAKHVCYRTLLSGAATEYLCARGMSVVMLCMEVNCQFATLYVVATLFMCRY